MLSKDVLAALLAFRSNREWEKFHTAKNLAASISIEASELLEIFQWCSDAEINAVSHSMRADIEREVADVVILLSYFCNDLQIDLERCVREKLAENDRKYPVDKAKGRATKYDQL